MATQNVPIAVYGRKDVKEKARKAYIEKHGNDDGFDPDQTFDRNFPVIPADFEDFDEVTDWLKSCKHCWNKKTLHDVASQINKHIADVYRRNYHAPSGQPSGKIMMNFMVNAPQDLIDTVQALMKEDQTDQAYEIIKAF